MAEKKPNILFIIIDHVAFAGHYGSDRYPYTWPRLEGLAAEGVWFDRAYCIAPICTPARASMMTGLRPSNHGMRWNNEYPILQNLNEFYPGQKLYSHFLSDEGYRNVFVGKWHCGHQMLPRDYGIEGWSLAEYGNIYGSSEYKAYLERIGESQPTCRVEKNLLLPDEECGKTVVLDPPDPWKYMDGYGVLEGSPEVHEQFFLANMACDWIDELAKDERPFCLVASFWGPHHPYFPSEAFAELVNPEDIPPYPSWDEDLTGKPQRYRAHRDLKGDYRAHEKWPDWGTWQTALARCYAQGLQTDAAVGRLLDKLEDAGLRDNTLVVLTADHGDTLATHGKVWDKMSTFPEELARIPMAIRWPGKIAPGQRIDKLVSNMDVPSTILAAAKAPSEDMDGRNLLPLCQADDNGDWPSHLICEHYGHSGDILHQRILILENWKYVAVYGDGDELYDLARDPFELNNLIADRGVADIRERCRRILRDDLITERKKRSRIHPPSDLENQLVHSTPRWPREERMLLHKLQQPDLI